MLGTVEIALKLEEFMMINKWIDSLKNLWEN